MGDQVHRSLKIGLLTVFSFGFGILTGLVGVGPGFVGAVILVFLFGLTASNARSFVTLLILAAAVPAMAIYGANGKVHQWGAALEAALGAILGALLCKAIFHDMFTIAVRRVAAVVLVAVGVGMLLHSSHVVHLTPGYHLTLGHAFALGAGSGFVASMASMATGVFLVPALVLIAGVPQKMAQSLALAAIIPACIPLAYSHYALGGVDKAGLWQYIIAAAFGGLLGAGIAVHLHSEVVTIIFGSYLLLLSILVFIRPRV
jgi:uncharacterized protein